ncbi:hypothetical protein KIW84_030956 [Lathyrus oleraceus]|uniref:Tf2-1-like SH3-like domain-containing protein n=1 Tax=Pisum sativum TaxID=3888 RepID=A0A9D4XTR9_PEA|nr:hypothetical protein KIW84_030956 [Pisum sativum]
MQQQENKHISDRQFQIGDDVYLKLQQHRQQSLRDSSFHKLSLKFYGPFRVLYIIGKVVYSLDLPPMADIHPLNDKVPETILGRKMVKRDHVAATKVLVQWKGLPTDEAT